MLIPRAARRWPWYVVETRSRNCEFGALSIRPGCVTGFTREICPESPILFLGAVG